MRSILHKYVLRQIAAKQNFIFLLYLYSKNGDVMMNSIRVVIERSLLQNDVRFLILTFLALLIQYGRNSNALSLYQLVHPVYSRRSNIIRALIVAHISNFQGWYHGMWYVGKRSALFSFDVALRRGQIVLLHNRRDVSKYFQIMPSYLFRKEQKTYDLYIPTFVFSIFGNLKINTWNSQHSFTN